MNAPQISPINEDMRLRFRSIFISDVHLGTYGCQADALLDFLKRTESDNLYLVGDIIDGWRLKQRWYWPQAHNDVVQKLLRKARKGTNVVFIPGNNDEFARDYNGIIVGQIPVRNHERHITAGGKRILIIHGDEFDGVVRYGKWLAHFGSWAYDMTVILNRWLNMARRKRGLPYWSLASYMKRQVKGATQFITNFEDAVVKHGRNEAADAVVCGHIHYPAMKDKGGIFYLNDGDWVENCTALVEEYDGTFRILKWTVGQEPGVLHSTEALK